MENQGADTDEGSSDCLTVRSGFRQHAGCMPRRTRLELPGYPLHVIQRGVNRCAIFVDDLDRHHLYDLLQEVMAEHGIAVHAYVFMGNHVHLLLTPPER